MRTDAPEKLHFPFFTRFNTWFESLVDRTQPDIIVAVARGAARLLQLAGVCKHQTQTVITHHGLPFLDDASLRGRRVLLFDDSIVFGSTMAEIAKYLEGRGAIVIPAAYVADQLAFYGDQHHPQSPHSWLQPQTGKRLPPDSVARHHSSIVQEVFHNGMDLNPDFPSVTIRFDELPVQEIPYFTRRLASRPLFHDLNNVTDPVSTRSRVQRWTALHDVGGPWDISCSCVVSRQQFPDGLSPRGFWGSERSEEGFARTMGLVRLALS